MNLLSKLTPLPSDVFATKLVELGAKWYVVNAEKPVETITGEVLFKPVKLQLWILPDGKTFCRER